ncbi:MAG: bifunctional methylenetetrahydrofolate dehydrogenase/methenyltetrahydrofolate cyclohydrolase FolD, partial [Myxococcales bacterium]|nr:bifunctional methylenetetrahydrofolate dehydrogenase/methenyltetrahydrofolate cyclohydrolase FolD [Myxococcales bacterium]
MTEQAQETNDPKRIDGKKSARRLLKGVKARVAACAERGVTPCLAVVLIGDNAASQVYVRNKERRAKKVGIATRDHRATGSTTEELLTVIRALNDDPEVDGILVQLPLPDNIDSDAILLAIAPDKDVDGFHPYNLGRLMIGRPRFVACTPQGCLHLLEEQGQSLAGKRALVVGRSTIVGKPVAHLLLQANATVTIAHSRTQNLAEEVARAEILVAAVGRAHCIKGEWIRPGALVIDVGINRLEDGSLTGDVEYEAARARASAITPVPGGVGPMTIACLLNNVVIAAERRAGLRDD